MNSDPILQNIRVIDIGQAVAVPYAAQLLGLMGAEVIRLETRHRLDNREWPPYADDLPGVNRSGYFNLLNCNKLGLTLNLRTEEGRDIARRLVAISDVVMENFATGTIERLGLGYEQLVKIRPDLVMLSISAFGRSGNMRDAVGYHSAVLMSSGLASITGYPGGHPRILGSVFPDPLSGMHGVLGILQALYLRGKSGAGQNIDTAMTEAMMSLMPEPIFDYFANDRPWARSGNRDRVKAPHGVYPCQLHGWIAISIGSPQEWNAFCEATGHCEWNEDPRFSDGLARWQHQEELDELIRVWTASLAPYEAMTLLQGAGVPAGVSMSPSDILRDPHLIDRGFVVDVSHPEVGHRPMGGVPWQISDTAKVEYRPAPRLGEHNKYLLCDLLGMAPRTFERLVENGVVH